MPPKLLVLVQPGGQTSVPIRQPDRWDGQACAACDRRIEDDPVVFLVADELRCRMCRESRPQVNGCVWCGRRPARVQDTGVRYCQPCWAIYVAYVSDEVEPPASPFRQLGADVYRIVREDAPRGYHQWDHPPSGEDRPSGARGPGPELGAD